MANMAVDGWLPRRFAAVSDRLTMQNGVILMSVAAVAALAYTRGGITLLVVMYAINVFITFSLAQLAMCRYWIRRAGEAGRAEGLAVHGVALALCASILGVMLFEKMAEGGWVTVGVTAGCVALCAAIRRHYRTVAARIREVERTFERLDEAISAAKEIPPFDPEAPTAAILVGGYGRLGLHSVLNIYRLFPMTFRNVVFVSVGVVDSDFFRGDGGVERIEAKVRETLRRYEEFARKMGVPSRSYHRVGTDVVDEAAELCLEAAKRHPRAVFFAGEIVFDEPHWWQRLLHNETAYAIQRRIRHAGLPLVVMPILLREKTA
jgi:hypothetical protein